LRLLLLRLLLLWMSTAFAPAVLGQRRRRQADGG
jgi:hypothetical protein